MKSDHMSLNFQASHILLFWASSPQKPFLQYISKYFLVFIYIYLCGFLDLYVHFSCIPNKLLTSDKKLHLPWNYFINYSQIAWKSFMTLEGIYLWLLNRFFYSFIWHCWESTLCYIPHTIGAWCSDRNREVLFTLIGL